MVVLLQTRREWFTSPFSSVYLLKNLHMNKKLLALLFAVPGFCAAQSAFETYKVMGFAPSLDQVAVESKNVEGHDVALAITRNGGWYADAKEALVGAGRDNSRQFRLVKTGKANVYKLYSVKKQKFVAYTDANQGDRKTKFVDNATDANTDWLIVPNIGAMVRPIISTFSRDRYLPPRQILRLGMLSEVPMKVPASAFMLRMTAVRAGVSKLQHKNSSSSAATVQPTSRTS